MTGLTFPDLAAARPIRFDDGVTVWCRPCSSIERDQAQIRTYGLLRKLDEDAAALEASHGIPAVQARHLSAASPLGFTRYLQTVLMAEACVTGWSGNLKTEGGEVDLATVEVTPSALAVFCLSPWRAARLQNFALDDVLAAEGNVSAAGSTMNSAADRKPAARALKSKAPAPPEA